MFYDGMSFSALKKLAVLLTYTAVSGGCPKTFSIVLLYSVSVVFRRKSEHEPIGRLHGVSG